MTSATPKGRSSALGITSVTMAMAVIAVAGGLAIANFGWQTGTIFLTSGIREHTAVGYVCASICLLGFAFGVEGFRRPTSLKALAIIGALLNFSLIAWMIAEPAILRFLHGPIGCF